MVDETQLQFTLDVTTPIYRVCVCNKCRSMKQLFDCRSMLDQQSLLIDCRFINSSINIL